MRCWALLQHTMTVFYVLRRTTVHKGYVTAVLLGCFIVLFAKNCTNQIKSNYLNSHGEEAQEKPPGL